MLDSVCIAAESSGIDESFLWVFFFFFHCMCHVGEDRLATEENTKYIYSSTMLMYNFEVLKLYLSISMLYFTYTSQYFTGKYCTVAPLHSFHRY